MSVHRVYASAVAALVLGSIAVTASAEESTIAPSSAPRFGRAGDFALSLSHDVSSSLTDLVTGETEITGSYFIIPNFSIGLGIGGQYLSTPTTSSSSTVDDTAQSTTTPGSTYTALELSPRVGYNLPFGQYVSIWPQIGFRFETANQSTAAFSTSQADYSSSSSSSTTKTFAFTATAPILIHPVRGFFIGAGPTFSTDLVNSTSSSSGGVSIPGTNNPKVTALALTALVGGVFGGE